MIKKADNFLSAFFYLFTKIAINALLIAVLAAWTHKKTPSRSRGVFLSERKD